VYYNSPYLTKLSPPTHRCVTLTQPMAFFLAAFATLFVIVASTILFFLCCSKSEPAKISSEGGDIAEETVVVFVDAPDPDNPAAVAAIAAKHISVLEGSRPHLHVVLTGRPVDLKTKKLVELSRSEIVRQHWESSVSEHAQRVMEDAAARFEGYLARCNLDLSNFTIYDGGVAPSAPLSDQFHEWDFLFDRRDLLTGEDSDKGSVVTPEEYKSLIHNFNKLTEEERATELLLLLRRYDLAPLSDLQNTIRHTQGDVTVFLGGPATALIELFSQEGADLGGRVSCVYGMFGALEPGRGTLLPNQFNVACDMEAACQLLVDDIFPSASKYMVATETCKSCSNLLVSAAELSQRNIAEYFVKLQELWEWTHHERVQPLFDVIPVMASLPRYRGCFSWKRQRAILQEWRRKDCDKVEQKFCYIAPRDTCASEGSDIAPRETRASEGSSDASVEENGGLFVSEREVKSLEKQEFLDFLEEVWS